MGSASPSVAAAGDLTEENRTRAPLLPVQLLDARSVRPGVAQPYPGIASYPAVPPAPVQGPPISDGSGLLIAGIVMQALFTLLWIDVGLNSFGILGNSIIIVFGVMMLVLAVLGAYLPLQKRQYSTAGPVTLILAILGFFLGFIVVGVLYIIAYVRINRARDASLRPANPQPVQVVYVPAPQPQAPVLRKCAYCGSDYSVTLAACPTCGAPA